ncbi:MAG: hypothetical protein O2887_01195 [Bacteroidetes bacterium]|nr:hypothetical protein [Bacteroidota bacterium]MDA1119105.1 hypothetical protein [Bacteroidota bacterium]
MPKPNFFHELKRRNVYKVAIAYVIVAWLIMQIGAIVLPAIKAPDWVMQALLFFLAIGFPIALILAWAFEMSPEGMIRTTSVEAEQNLYPDDKKKPLTSKVAIGVLLLALVGQFVYNKYWSSNSSDPSTIENADTLAIDKSIAVLPFADMSPDKDQEYFCDGISEEIINALAQIPDLKVSSRTSVFQFRGAAKDIKSIAETLGVATILEGSIRKSQNRIRVTAQLINAADGFHLWSQTYEREMEDIFAIQDELSKSIVGALQVHITSTSGSLVKKQTANMVVYNLYLEGRYFWNKRSGEGLQKSLDLFNKAVDADPLYALAYVGVADAYNMLSTYGHIDPLEGYPKARAAALKALELDNTSGQAYAALAYPQMFYDFDWDAAEQSFQKAISLSPNYASAYQWHFLLLQALGKQDEAYSELTKALELDPLSLVGHYLFALHFNKTGDYDKAIEWAEKALEMEPNFYQTHSAVYFLLLTWRPEFGF